MRPVPDTFSQYIPRPLAAFLANATRGKKLQGRVLKNLPEKNPGSAYGRLGKSILSAQGQNHHTLVCPVPDTLPAVSIPATKAQCSTACAHVQSRSSPLVRPGVLQGYFKLAGARCAIGSGCTVVLLADSQVGLGFSLFGEGSVRHRICHPADPL